ncbi:MAG: NosD domain-containing protein [Desulfurococcaceae archaeon]
MREVFVNSFYSREFLCQAFPVALNYSDYLDYSDYSVEYDSNTRYVKYIGQSIKQNVKTTSLENINFTIACDSIDEPGYYVLTEDIKYEFEPYTICYYINSSHVILDGNNHIIRNTGSEVDTRLAIVVAKGVENITIRNIRVVNFASGIDIYLNKDVKIVNSRFLYVSSSISIVGSKNVEIVNNVFSNNDGFCILAGNVERLTIAGNKFKYCGGFGISISSSEVSSDIEIYNNTFTMGIVRDFLGESGERALYIVNGENVRVFNNYVADGTGFSFRDISNLEIFNNTLVQISEPKAFTTVEINLWDNTSNVKIYNNVLKEKTGGISIWNAWNIEIFNNTIKSIVGIVMFEYSHDIYVYNNVFKDNDGGISLYTTVSNVYIYNNLFLCKKANIEVLVDKDSDVKTIRNVYLNTTLTRGRNILGGTWIGGNAWLSPSNDGFSQTCRDEVEPIGICDEPFIYRSNESILIDYLPLSLKEILDVTVTETKTETITETETIRETETLIVESPRFITRTETVTEVVEREKSIDYLPIVFAIILTIVAVNTILIKTFLSKKQVVQKQQ